MFSKYEEQKDTSELRNRAEELLRRSPRDISIEDYRDIQKLIHELSVYQVELEMQNENLRNAQLELEESRDKYLDLYKTVPVAYLTLNKEGLIVEANNTSLKLFGLRKCDLINSSITHLIAPDSQDTFYLVTRKIFKTGKKQSCVLQMKTSDGKIINGYLEGIGVTDPGGVIVNQRIVITNITEIKQLEDALRESGERYRSLSLTDELTGLYNRRHFYNVLENEMSRTQRHGHSFSIVMLDLDGFKEYNDRLGHINGDKALQSLAQMLRSTLRKADIAFRYGGDEFTIILPMTDIHRAKEITERIRSHWLNMPKTEELIMERPLGFSAGIVQFPENAETTDGLIFLADAALFYSKNQGGYQTTVVSELESIPADVLNTATLDQVYALAATVDARDSNTYGHSRRVAIVSEAIGRAIGLSHEELITMHAAALLHDIGKIGIPDSILTKPGRLTKNEWAIMKTHATEAARIVRHIKGLSSTLPIILHHHEWYDGTGYPDGLKGEDIPVSARIVAVADAYDTMTTPRLYKTLMSLEEALMELNRCSGTQFDPALVKALPQAISQAVYKKGN